VKRIIFASSIQAYGIVSNRAEAKPTPPQYLPVDEEHPLLPRDAYPLSKAMGEWIAESFVRARPEFSVFSLRFTHITAKVPAGAGRDAIGHALLTAVHPDDAAEAVRLCCLTDRPGLTALNVVSPLATTPWEMGWLRDLYGCEPPLRRELNPTDSLIASDRARELLGFTARRHPAREEAGAALDPARGAA
jgi:nucleoside-diphosphate-sugar epimerase